MPSDYLSIPACTVLALSLSYSGAPITQKSFYQMSLIEAQTKIWNFSNSISLIFDVCGCRRFPVTDEIRLNQLHFSLLLSSPSPSSSSSAALRQDRLEQSEILPLSKHTRRRKQYCARKQSPSKKIGQNSEEIFDAEKGPSAAARWSRGLKY